MSKSNSKQLQINFSTNKKEVKVISLQKVRNKDLNTRILNRKRPSL